MNDLILLKWYDFRQNNSGGSFTHDANRGIGLTVLIQAANADEANRRAEDIGLYFDGCITGDDCSCCGDRWYSQWSDELGNLRPMIYDDVMEPCTEAQADLDMWGVPSYMHFYDGSFSACKKADAAIEA